MGVFEGNIGGEVKIVFASCNVQIFVTKALVELSQIVREAG